MRLFVALKTNLNKKDIFSLEKTLMKNFSDVKWVEEENLHLTLKFLGEVEESKLSTVEQVLLRTSREFNSFSFYFSGISGFPNENNARVLFVSVSDADKLVKLMISLDEGFYRIGFKKERSYVPHLTLGRAKRKGVNLKRINKLQFNPIKVDTSGIILVKSTLTPNGPIYNVISSFEFA